MAQVLAGHPSKNIAADLGISQRTVENHRAAIMHRTGARSLPELTRLSCPPNGRRSLTSVDDHVAFGAMLPTGRAWAGED